LTAYAASLLVSKRYAGKRMTCIGNTSALYRGLARLFAVTSKQSKQDTARRSENVLVNITLYVAQQAIIAFTYPHLADS
jgi:hypothetical protein